VEGPWQVEAVNLVGGVCMAPQGDVVGRERPLSAREAQPPAPRPPPPLLEPSTGSEVQKPLEGRAPSGDTKEITPSEQHTRQTPVHRKDLVHDRIICGRYKDSTGHRTGKRTNIRGSYEHHANINRSLSRCTVISYSGPCRSRPCVAVCFLGSSNGGAFPTASGLVQYSFK